MRTTTNTTHATLTNGYQVEVDYRHTAGSRGDRWTPADPGEVEILALIAESGRVLSARAMALVMGDATNRDRVMQAAYDHAAEMDDAADAWEVC